MSAERGSAYVQIEEFVANFKAGWTIEVECTETAVVSYAGYRGRWILRCISNDGQIRTLATSRKRDAPREIKTQDGVSKLIREELGAKIGPQIWDKGVVGRFNRDWLIP